jgi:uncharacterized protein involved in outer membrane biogenesis
MPRKLLVGVCLAAAALAAGLFLWVRAVFTDDVVRSALASQLSSALGQPVTIGGIGAGLYPRVTVNLKDVAIGEPARIRVRTLHVGASLGALFSRRIEHARLELADARIDLPLPAFAFTSGAPTPSGAAPVELVSVDAVVLRNVEVVSGGRTMTGDIDVVPEGRGATIRKVRLRTDDTTIDVTGRLTDLSGPAGDLSIKAGTLNFDRLLAFANEFAAGSGMKPAASPSASSHRSGSSGRPPAAAPMNVGIALAADRATIGELVLDKLAGKARLTNEAMRLDPIDFGVFGGHYKGSLVFRLSDTPDVAVRATLAGVDVAAASRFAGSPGTISGTLSGRLNIAGRGLTAASLLQSAHGGARLDIVNGVVNNLGLVRSIVVATSGRADGGGAGAGRRDEPFSRLGATLTIGGGTATTTDLRFESPDLLLGATGTLHLDGSSINLAGRAQLSEELSRQAGRDLVRYTQEGGRVTLPVTVTGSAAAPHVRIDVGDAAKRAVVNRANEEGQKALKKGIESLFKR